MKDSNIEFIVKGIPPELYPRLVENEKTKIISKYFDNEGKVVREIPLCDYLKLCAIFIKKQRKTENIKNYVKKTESSNLLEDAGTDQIYTKLINELSDKIEKCSKILNDICSLIERINELNDIK